MNDHLQKVLAVLVITLFSTVAAFAQDKGEYNKSVIVLPNNTGQLALDHITSLDKKVKKGSVKVISSFGDDYTFGKPGGDTDFDLTVSFTLSGLSGTSTVFSKDYSFTITNSNPEGYIFRDLRSNILPSGNSSTGLDIDQIELSSFIVTDNSGNSYTKALSDLQLELSYQINYGIDVNMLGQDIVLQEVDTTAVTRSLSFAWESNRPYPNYQFQLLRLHNIDAARMDDEQLIKAKIDWDKAVTIETESSAKELDLTIAEGTGFYVWRVRPIGTWYDGGIADSRNWGAWDDPVPANGDEVTLPEDAVPEKYFFFVDHEDDKNYMYTRIFSEENKIKEQITYANGLLQQKQTQVYIPSDSKTITSQTIHDYSGRPAVKTMPVPVDGELGDYKEKFVTTADDEDDDLEPELYTEEHFDTESTINDPTVVEPGTPVGDYYTGQNDVPSAEGYPYSRVIFYNDGTGRIKEQSGVGKTHMVGSQQDGRGRTVRTFYATPAEDELLALFGSEAPNHETVQKVITIDQNNIASISYTGKDGKVLATALSFVEGASTNLLPLSEPDSIPVSDRLTGGVKTGDGYITSKRLVFTEPTNFAPEYRIECKSFEQLCGDVELECDYEVQIKIHNIDNPADSIVLRSDVSTTDCTPVTVCDTTRDYFIISSIDWEQTMPLTLAPGTYMVEKRLIPSGDISVELTNQEEKIKEQIDPIKNWITSSLESVSCPEELETFYNNLITLGKLFADNTLQQSNEFDCEGCNGNINFPDSFWDIYTEPLLTDQFQISVIGINGPILNTPFTDSPVQVVISTPCCEQIVLDVTYTPPFKCPPVSLVSLDNPDSRPVAEGGDPASLDVNDDYLTHPEWNEYYPDFEGYAISMLKECPSFMGGLCAGMSDEDCEAIKTQAAKNILYGYMPGWGEGDLNKMVYHMITDEYSCNGNGINSPGPGEDMDPEPEAVNACTPADESQIPGTQYRCADLADCWMGLVMVLTQSYCIDPADLIGDMSEGGSVSDAFDDQADEGEEGKHDSQFDDGLADADIPGLLKWIAKQKMSKKLRDMQDPESDAPLPPEDQLNSSFHLIDMFLNCTGYKFADVLEPAPEGACGSNGVVHEKLRVPGDFDGDQSNGEYNSCTYKTSNWIDTPVDLDKNFDPVDGSRTIEDLFPNIYNPVYAFKYYEYASGTYPNLEAMTCYRDPNDCVNAEGETIPCCGNESDPFCVKEYGHPRADRSDGGGNYKLLVKDFCGMGTLSCPYLKEDWTCDQRDQFFNMLKSYQETEYEKPEYEITCNWMTEEKKWYEVPASASDSTTLDYIDESLYFKYTETTPSQEDAVSLPGLKEVNGETHYLQEEMKENITYVEYLAAGKKKECVETCDSRRNEFREAVMQMFTDRCYVFEGCKRTADDNIVNPADIERIVDQIVDQCQRQCPLTTYTCATESCRLISTPWKGVDMEIGPNSSFTDLQFGAGGHPTATNDCPAGVGEMTPCCSNTDGGMPPVTIDDIPCSSAYDLTYYEQTNHLQATEWNLQLDVVSKCNSEGQYVDSDNDGAVDDYPLYIYKTDLEGNRTLVPQTAGDLSCPPRPPGDTFVEKNDYKIPHNTPLETQKYNYVESPKIGITVDTGN